MKPTKLPKQIVRAYWVSTLCFSLFGILLSVWTNYLLATSTSFLAQMQKTQAILASSGISIQISTPDGTNTSTVPNFVAMVFLFFVFIQIVFWQVAGYWERKQRPAADA